MCYLALNYLIATKDTVTTFYIILAINIIDLVTSPSFNFLMPFVTSVADERIGGTAITAFMSIFNASSMIPGTIGLKIASAVPYELYGGVVLFIWLMIAIFGYRLADSLDNKDSQE